MVLAGAILGAALTAAAPQVPLGLDRPACAERVMQAVASDQAVKGTYSCFDGPLQIGLASIGVDSDSSFANRIGQNGDYHFLHKTADGGYAYEFDRPTTPHDRWWGAASALKLLKMRSDVRSWNFLAVWHEPIDVHLAWQEVSGQTQNDESHVFTIYMGADGKIKAIK